MKRKKNQKANNIVALPLGRKQNPAHESGIRRIAVQFQCAAPRAEKVCIAGDFNGWDAGANRLDQEETGVWTTCLPLAPGIYQYRFIVDGEWHDDPEASRRIPNGFGSSNCVIEVWPADEGLIQLNRFTARG